MNPLLPNIAVLPYGDFEALNRITEKTAGVFAEMLQAEAGYQTAPADWLLALRNRCTEVGALLVADEIQTGFGRTGSLWAFEQAGLLPDVLCMAKAMGGGMPLGGFAAAPEVMRTLSYNPILGHITTFGGHPVSCAAGLAALTVLTEERLWERCTMIEEVARECLSPFAPLTGRGAMLAWELGSFERVFATANAAQLLGVVTDWFLFNTNRIRIAPPLTIAENDLRWACAQLVVAAGF